MVIYFLQGNHGSGSHTNEDIKVFKKHRLSDHLYTILLSMPMKKYRHFKVITSKHKAYTLRNISVSRHTLQINRRLLIDTE